MDSKLCRICLIKSGTISLFAVEKDMQYSEKIMKCVNIIINEDDGLPNMMCEMCSKELAITYDFLQKCQSSDKTLRLCSTIEPNIVFKHEDIKIEPEYDESYDNIHSIDNQDIGNQDEYIQEVTKTLPREKKVKRYVQKKIKRSKMGPIQCVICGLMAISRSAMETHMRTHTGEKPFSCHSCEARFPTKGALKRHMTTYHSKRERKFTCETCGNSFFTKSDIITHIRIHTDEKPYVCPFCSKSFRQIASLIRHKRVHTGEKPFSCPICEKKFADRNLVKKHQSVHSDERKYSCHLCAKSVKSKTALNTHLSIHSNEQKNICSYCGMTFSMKGNLQTHMRRIHSERSGQCTVCLKTFPDLEEHMRKHTGERPFVCNVCNQAFAIKRSLAHHIAFRHENATKFKCSIGDCIKTFPTAMMLEFHLLKQHTNHTPYVCQHCSRGFFRNSDLSRHLKVSHMEVPVKMSIKTQDS